MGPRRAREIEKTFNLGTGEMDREVTVVDRQQSELPVMAASEALDWLGCDHGNCVPESTNRAPAVGEHLPGSFYLVLEDDVDSQLARSGDWLLMTAGEPKNCSSKMLVYAAVEGYRPMLCWYRRQLDKVDLWNDSFKKSFDARQVGVRVVAYGTTTIRPHRTMGFAVRPGQ
ncbi:hypothetical protein SAMN02745129_2422 [Ferrimonas marina]|uniref:Uncharacterized protein n=2 Tax=Ferrimonas marina TaxID=299255 RepID=A0A1M5U625_9GAMM|nr:hypothetical protein SAMN02745129_2422 [Ferrimonas marina]